MIEQGFKKWLVETDTVILVCWDLGHVWDADLYDRIERRPHGAHMMTGHCYRGCGVERARYLNSSWAPDAGKNTYKYPRGYSPRSFVQGPFFMSWEHKAAIRKELAKRARTDAAEFHAAGVSSAKITDIRAKFSG